MKVNVSKSRYKEIKKDYIRTLSSNTLYNYLTPQQVTLITKYYEVYTIELFKEIRGGLRLEVSKQKADKLIQLRGEGDWEFAGMVDKQIQGADHCELGHSLRYVYYARNLSNGYMLKFGSTCVGDFFDIDGKGIKALNKLKTDMMKEIKEMIAIMQNNILKEHCKYDLGLYGRLLTEIGLEGLDRLRPSKKLLIAKSFILNGMPLPKSLAQFLEDDKSIKEQVTPTLLGLEGNLKLIDSPIKVLSYESKKYVENLKNKVLNSDYTILDNLMYDDCLGIKDSDKWLKRGSRLEKAFEYYNEKIGITDWYELKGVYNDYKAIRGSNLVLDSVYDYIEFMCIFNKGCQVGRGYVRNTNTYPIKVNGIDVKKHLVSQFDYILDKLKDKEVMKVIYDINIYLKTKREKEGKTVKDDYEIYRYLKDALSLEENYLIYSSLGKLYSIATDIIITKGLNFNSMSEKQKDLVKKTYKKMLEVDNKGKSIGVNVNNSYRLDKRPDIELKINYIKNAKNYKDLDEKTKCIIDNVLKYKKVSDKQIKYIVKAYDGLDYSDKPSEIVNNFYKLEDRPDIVSMIEMLSNGYNSDKTLKDILNTINKYGKVSDKQIYYIRGKYIS